MKTPGLDFVKLYALMKLSTVQSHLRSKYS